MWRESVRGIAGLFFTLMRGADEQFNLKELPPGIKKKRRAIGN